MEKKLVDVGAVIDSAKFFWVPAGIALMMIIIMLTDGYDLFLMGHVGNHLVNDWGVSRANLGPINTAGLLGMAVGSVGLGWLGDIIGRKRSYFTCLVLLFVGSVLCYYAARQGTPENAAATLNQMTMWRFVTGLGMGGVTPLATTLISEWTSIKVRSVVVALVISAVPVGGSLAGWTIQHVEWEQMFLIGGLVPLVLFVAFGFLMPESPKFMAQHPAQHARLARALNRLVGEKRFDGTEEFRVVEQGKRSSHWLATIWNSHYAKATLFIWLAFSFNSFVLYLYTNYLKVLLTTDGISEGIAGSALSLFSIGAFFGSIGGAFFIRWFGSRWVGTLLAFLGVAATFLIGAVTAATTNPTDDTILVLAFTVGMSINGMQAFMYAVSAHSYPTEIRGSAVGMAQTVSRIGAVMSPMVASYYFGLQPTPTVNLFFWFVAGCAFITTLSFFLIPSHIPHHKKV
ncbi:MAG: MFS transporter [Proteobacteria bacterium]|nr:MFS transporter [Pseudomonadota bacterium]MBK9252421.1 MFS transporter [Pseudomonadota bacterium]MCC6631114.1 MFS transporter [Gammaproteobacteria bacterium]